MCAWCQHLFGLKFHFMAVQPNWALAAQAACSDGGCDGDCDEMSVYHGDECKRKPAGQPHRFVKARNGGCVAAEHGTHTDCAYPSSPTKPHTADDSGSAATPAAASGTADKLPTATATQAWFSVRIVYLVRYLVDARAIVAGPCSSQDGCQ